MSPIFKVGYPQFFEQQKRLLLSPISHVMPELPNPCDLKELRRSLADLSMHVQGDDQKILYFIRMHFVLIGLKEACTFYQCEQDPQEMLVLEYLDFFLKYPSSDFFYDFLFFLGNENPCDVYFRAILREWQNRGVILMDAVKDQAFLMQLNSLFWALKASAAEIETPRP